MFDLAHFQYIVCRTKLENKKLVSKNRKGVPLINDRRINVFTGGVAKYVELLVSKKAFNLENMLDEVFRENSLFIDEGRNVLIEEFGKDYATYFSILSLIASSMTTRL